MHRFSVCLFIITLLGIIESIAAYTSIPVRESVNLLDPDDFNERYKTDLTTYGVYAYQYMTLSGVYDQLFNVSFTPQDAYLAYLDSATVFSVDLYRPFTGDLPLRIAEAGRRAFARGATPYRFFRSFVSFYDIFLKGKNILDESNARHLAYLYYVALDENLKEMGTPMNSFEKFHTLSIGNAKYLASLLDVTQEDLINGQKLYIKVIDEI